MDNLEEIKCEKLVLHFKYVALILFLMFVFAATGAWTDRVNFTEYLTNAATMISIVLGLVAIFYSFVSNTSLSQSLGNISTVSSGIDKSNQMVKQFIDQAESLNRESANSSQRMQIVSSNIDVQLNSLNDVLNQIVTKSTELQASISVLPTKADLEDVILENKSKDSTNISSQSSRQEIEFSKVTIQKFIDRSPLIVNVFLYALQQVYKRQISVHLSEIVKLINEFNDDYFMAYMSCCQAIGLLKREWNVDKGLFFRITEMEEHFAENNIEKDLREYLESNTETRVELIQQTQKALDDVKDYFEKLEVKS
ncbi:hypothetical protein [Methylophilus methylotrophus]|uniref:hypothetical protein n=1 Tax=Methylophilus methylotrophus TaxID=17 RepID=UPI000F5991AE|nr:hypothetical protein [Methylophilus methylotrophus]